MKDNGWDEAMKAYNKRFQFDAVRAVQLGACSFLKFSHTIGHRIQLD